jgi:hypothetical protein
MRAAAAAVRGGSRFDCWPNQIQRHSFASPIVTGAIRTITASTNQKSIGSSKSPTLKFIPITPAIRRPGAGSLR